MNNGTFVNSRSYSSISASLRKRIPEFAKRYSYEKIYAALRVLGDIDKRQKTSYSINETEFLYFIGNVLE
jgi:DNA polymerase III delta subunit